MSRKEKVLIFTDSRGQHVSVDGNHKVFAERLQDELPDHEFELMLCPMKWTTIVDFLEFIEQVNISKYKWIILYCGIVDWSPRPYQSAINDLYNNCGNKNLGVLDFNTSDYSRKIVNNKKDKFDECFGAGKIVEYLNKPFDTRFQGEKTINMYSLEMAKEGILTRLKSIPNLIFINSNKLLADWNGDHIKGRPENMALTHEYSRLFADTLPIERVVDLQVWNEEEVEKYTCDNIHLTEAGNEYILERLLHIMGNEELLATATNYRQPEIILESDLSKLFPIRPPGQTSDAALHMVESETGKNKCLATLIIGFRFSDDAPERLTHLKFLLEWIDHYFGGMFDVLLIEQDDHKKFPSDQFQLQSYVRYQFIFNPDSYNRGWGYNVAVRHFCAKSDVVVFLDVDILPGENFLTEIIACHKGEYDAISPYQNVYDSDADETINIFNSMDTGFLFDQGKLKRPVSISGGILIINKELFIRVKGFEQYRGYSCEDRALDVTLLNHLSSEKIRIAPFVYTHLFHPPDTTGRKNFDDIYSHLKQYYQCAYYTSLKATDFIHSMCSHSAPSQTLALMELRASSFGDLDLYKKIGPLSINGIRKMASVPNRKIILPTEFCDFDGYKERELYDAPDPDVDDIRKLYNVFLGERCFVIGNGPSLNKHDLSLLEGEYTFGVNGIFYKTEETGFCPYFYVVEDSSVMKENIEAIKAFKKPKFKFFPTVYKNIHPKDENTIFFKMNRGFYEKTSPNYCVPRFSTDASDQLFCGQSVTHINLQLAYFMGFTEVYLIGMDFSYVIPDSHKRTGDVLLSDTDDENHFHSSYFGKGKTWKDPKLDRVEMNYRQAKLDYESTGRHIYNASVGGKLEVFDRVEYESLFHGRVTDVNHSASMARKFLHQSENVRLANSKSDQVSRSPKGRPGLVRQSGFGSAWRFNYARIAEKIKSRSLTLFLIGQFTMWVLQFLKRHPTASAFGLAVLFVFIFAPIFVSRITPYASYFWIAAGLLILSAISILGVSFGNKKTMEFAEREHRYRQALRAEMMRDLKKSRDRHESQGQQQAKLVDQLTSQSQRHDELTAVVDKIRKQGEEIAQSQDDLSTRVASQEQHHEALDRKYDGLVASAPMFNFGNYQSFNRRLSKAHVDVLQQEWSAKLGLKFTPKSLAYLAHRICTLETTSRGRLATTVEDAVLRVLVASAARNKNLRVLEIGTLFGIGLSVIYDHTRSRFNSVHLTAIDPLDGYYGKDVRDIVTDEAIDEQTFRSNLATVDVPEQDCTLIKSMSTEDSAIESAAESPHDVLIIDGDHSYAGVKADFVNYLPAVKRGGYIIFDDYDAPGWPGVKEFVDTCVRDNPEVTLVGTSWRTAVFRVVGKEAARQRESE